MATPTPTPLSTNLDYISRAKQRLYTTFASRRPWLQIFDYHALSCPPRTSLIPTTLMRIKTNLSYFRVNFAMFVLLVIFLSLLWHPISLIVFLATLLAWLFLFFLRDTPLLLFNREIDDRIVLAVLSVLTVVFLLLTRVTANVLISLSVGLLVVLLYSVFRRTDDLFLDEDDAAAGGLLAGRTGFGPIYSAPPSSSSPSV